MSLIMTKQEREAFLPTFTLASLAFPTKVEDRSRCRTAADGMRVSQIQESGTQINRVDVPGVAYSLQVSVAAYDCYCLLRFEGILKISRLTSTSNKKEGGDTVKNMIRILVIALTTLSFSALGFAQAKPATPTTPATPAAPATEKKTEMKAEKVKTHRITGEVTSLDAKAGTFAVKEKDKEIKLTADSKSAKDTLAKLKVGDMVRVSYTEKDGKMTASSVKAESKKATEKKADVTEKKPATK